MPLTPRARVLVLESEAHPLSALTEHLEGMGIWCDRTQCGEGAYIQATEAHRKGKPSQYDAFIVDLDCTSTGESGYTPVRFLESVRLTHPFAPCIGFTGNPARAQLLEHIAQPCVTLLRYPEELKDFCRYLSRLTRHLVLSAPQPT